MTTPKALIVDDSKTAQFKLAKHLKNYALEIETATSAEEALGYLTYTMPTVIFMDHHMEGMDGLEALKTIKANPTTATIPVIMYTSEKGEVYAGQAHALGALDILSKEILHPSSIEAALAKLSIHPKERDADSIPPYSLLPQEGDSSQTFEQQIDQAKQDIMHSIDQKSSVNPDEIKMQVARLFELHIADVRTLIAENTKFMVRRLSGEIKQATHNESNIKSDDIPPLSALSEAVEDKATKMGFTSNAMLLLILIALSTISFQLFNTQKDLHALEDSYMVLTEINTQKNALLDEALAGETLAPLPQPKANLEDQLPLINWILNTDLSFGFGETPLNTATVLNLQNLVFQLSNAGFEGIIDLEINLGNFCVKPTQENGKWVIADHNTPLAECAFMADIQIPNNEAKNYISHEYIQFEQTSNAIQSGNIEILISANEYDAPLHSYPAKTLPLTAGQWNEIASKNNRLVLSIEAN